MSFILFIIFFFVLIAVFKPKYKLLYSFIIMTNGFDFLPSEISSIKLWDIGFFMFIFCFIQKYLKTRLIKIPDNTIMKTVGLFLCYLVFEFFMSIYYFQYPLIKTIQASRQMILGYTLPYLFIYLFTDYNNVYDNFMGLLYKSVYAVTAIHILQFIINKPLLFGYQGDYSGMMRSIPVFIPLTLLFLWKNLSSFYSGLKLSKQDIFYVLLAITSLSLTFTRGLYLSLGICLIILLLFLVIQKKIKLNRIFFTVFSIVLLLTVFGSFIPDAVTDRITDSFTALQEGSSYYSNKDNNFSFRLLLLEERINMVTDSNPLFGYGFIHEDIAKRQLIWSIGTGNYEGGIGFASADIAWANIVIYTGFLGLLLFLLFVFSVIFSYPLKIKKKWFGKSLFNNDSMMLAFYIQFIGMIILMTNSSVFTNQNQIVSLILSGYIITKNNITREHENNDNYTII